MKGIVRALQASFIVNFYNIMYCFKLNIRPPRFNSSSMFQTEHKISICYDEQCVKCIHYQKSCLFNVCAGCTLLQSHNAVSHISAVCLNICPHY